MTPTGIAAFAFLLLSLQAGTAAIVSFPNGQAILKGFLYKPDGPGAFPAVIYNHGSSFGCSSAKFKSSDLLLSS